MPSSASGAADSDVNGDQPNMFEVLCENVHTSMLTHNGTLEQFFNFKDELLKHALPPKLLANLTLLSSKLFRSYSEFSLPVNELTRMVRQHSTPWEERADSLKGIRSDYDSMRTKLSIALKRIELMSAGEERIKKERRLGNWERLFVKTMESESHGRRWKFRIEPLKRKMQQDGFNPYLSDSSGDDSDEDDNQKKYLSTVEKSETELSESDDDTDRESSSMHEVEQVQATPTPPPPPIETAESAACTKDPDYDQYLLVQLYRPNGLLKGKDVCCTLAYGQEYYTTDVYPGRTDPGSVLTHQSFHFKLSDDAARTLPPERQEPLDAIDVSKVTLTVYPGTIAQDMAAYLSIVLKELHITEESTVIVPPEDTAEERTELNWEEIDSKVKGFPQEYLLKMQTQQTTDEEEDEPSLPLIPMICHRVKVQRHKTMHSGTETLPWDVLMEHLGYRLVPDTQSRAVSMICFEEPPSEEPEMEEKAEEVVSQQELAALSLQHAQEICKLQEEFGKKLNSLTGTLSRVRADKAKEIEQLEQALVEAEQRRGGKGRSASDIRSLIARKKKLNSKITHGLPNWGEGLPQDFFERMEMFAEESLRKQEELTDRIKREVSVACEKQLATQHKLAPGITRTDIDTITEDVSLPALFMPTRCTKNLVFTPRAHRYFHPPGSSEARVTQPPAVFALPPLSSNQLNTLNLFELSQSSPQWLRDHTHQSPRYTPAPPSSACDHYHMDPHTGHYHMDPHTEHYHMDPHTEHYHMDPHTASSSSHDSRGTYYNSEL